MRREYVAVIVNFGPSIYLARGTKEECQTVCQENPGAVVRPVYKTWDEMEEATTL